MTFPFWWKPDGTVGAFLYFRLFGTLHSREQRKLRAIQAVIKEHFPGLGPDVGTMKHPETKRILRVLVIKFYKAQGCPHCGGLAGETVGGGSANGMFCNRCGWTEEIPT